MSKKQLGAYLLAILTAGCANQALGTGNGKAFWEAKAKPDRSIQNAANGRVMVLLREGADVGAFQARLAASGIRLRGIEATLGLASVEGVTPASLEGDPAVAGAQYDMPRPRLHPVAARHLARQEGATAEPPVPEPLQELQWGLASIQAPEAWAAGAEGRGARVAVLDTGIDVDNPDLTPNLDLANSRSFITTEDLTDLHGHGSHVAGTIAAARNGFGVVGVAPAAQVVAVKVLDQQGYGDDFGIMQGIRYAADLGVNVINMSLETRLPWGSAEAGQLAIAYSRAIRYATRRGALVVAGSGNDAESELFSGWTHLPVSLPNVLGVSATGPVGQQNFNAFAIYSNYGSTLVDLAAPGGGIAYDPQTGPQVVDPRDLVLSTWSTHALPQVIIGYPIGPALWSYFAGTSMACAHVSGVAALAFAVHHEPPSTIAARLRNTAQGTGFNPYLGNGIVNALRAIGR
ncbi:MAG: S8 family serine peptidase [Cyanobacteria bacterium NC_groundwater_1444_Ag_S-0.65um_54_12]|nr:S8 family serine peptidase [Cyanobacteria bacterium NC_groundwater_1444_Ag_S-0.65um_54_12]